MNLRVPLQKTFSRLYVTLMSGLLRLTDTELLVLSEIVWDIYKTKNEELVFSPEGRQEIRKRLLNTGKKMTQHNFNNYLMSLKKKDAIKYVDGKYVINPWLIPREEISFKFKVDERFTSI